MLITEADAAALAVLLRDEGGCEAMLPLRTDRLVLRPPRPDDTPALMPLAGAWDVARWAASIPHPLTETDVHRWIDEADTHRRGGTGLVLVITERAGGAVVGAIDLRWDRLWPAGDVGVWIAPAVQGRGYATEALRAILGFGFQTVGLSSIRTDVQIDNAPSRRVLERCGLRPDGRRSGVLVRALGEARDHVGYAVSRDAWAADRAARSRIVLVVAAALVDLDGRVLLARRPEGKPMAGLWEFPGGKVHDGETPEAALVRELHEELGVDVRHACLAPLTFASHAYPDFHLLMPVFVVRSWSGRITPREGQETAWVRAARLRDYPMPAADLPLIPALQDLLC